MTQGPWAGQEWPLTSDRFLVGSDESCQLQITDNESPAFAFQILRGQRGLLVRGLHSTARLNGQILTSISRLRTGDRLGVGDVEFKLERAVVADQAPNLGAPRFDLPAEPTRPSTGRIAAALHLVEHLTNWERRCHAVEADLAEARTTLEQSQLERQHWEDRYGEAVGELNELREAQASWLESQQDFQKRLRLAEEQTLAQQLQQDQLLADATEQTNRLSALQAQVAQLQLDAASALERWELERSGLVATAQAKDTDLAKVRADLEQARVERDSQARDVSRLQRDLQALQDEFQKARSSWDRERSDLANAFELAQGDLESLESLPAELEQATAAIERLQSDLTAAQSQLRERSDSVQWLQDRVRELETATEGAREEWAQERAALLETQLAAEQNDSEMSQLRTQLQSLQAEASFWKERAEELNDQRSREPVCPVPSTPWSSEWADSEPKNDPPAVTTSNEDALDVLQEVQHALHELRHSHDDLEPTSPHAPSPRMEEALERIHKPEIIPLAASEEVADIEAPFGFGVPEIAAEPGEGDDESIELYMNRLLERIRGEQRTVRPGLTRTHEPSSSVSPPAFAFSSTASVTPTAAPIVAVPVSTTDEPTEVNAETLSQEPIRRTKVPEQVSDLAAMRELANTSARAAIQTSHQQSRIQDLMARIMMSGSVILLTLGVAYAVRSKPTLVGLVAAAGIWFCLWMVWPGFRKSVIGPLTDQPEGEPVVASQNSEEEPTPVEVLEPGDDEESSAALMAEPVGVE